MKSVFVLIAYNVNETTIPKTIIVAINTIYEDVVPQINDTIIDSNIVNKNRQM